MTTTPGEGDADLQDAVRGLERGDFSRLEPLFLPDAPSVDGRPRVLAWYDAGRFRNEPKALAEALTCASFLGCVEVAEYLLKQGVDPAAGNGTGLDALHWAANRGELAAVQLLFLHDAPLETRNMYGGTPLGATVWAAINEPRGNQLGVIEELLVAGARIEEAGYPTGHAGVDAILQRYGAA